MKSLQIIRPLTLHLENIVPEVIDPASALLESGH
jgi:hypothetical protein